MQTADLDAGLAAQGRIQVRKRFVEEQHLRFAGNGAADGHALALAARELARVAVEQVFQLQDASGVAHAFVDLGLAEPCNLQAEGDVVVDAHMRVKRIGLEDHGNAAFRRRHTAHGASADADIAGGDLFQPGNHLEQRGLAAAGRADKDDELAILDIEIDAVDDFMAVIGLAQGVQRYGAHGDVSGLFDRPVI